MDKLIVKRLEVGQMKANCYLVLNEKDEELVIIDPGEEVDYIQNNINDTGFSPNMILLTHGHFDHILRAEELRLTYKIPAFLSKDDEFLAGNMIGSANKFSESGAALPLEDAKTYENNISFLGRDAKVLKTPGHTPGSVSIYIPSEEVVFVGDLVFEGGSVGRYDFSYSDKDRLFKSIDTLLGLPNEVRVFPGHGRPTTIEALKYYF